MDIPKEEFKRFIHLINNNNSFSNIYYNNYSLSKMMYNAIHSNSITILKVLIEDTSGVLLDGTNTMTPLYMASSDGHADIVTFLIEQGVNVNKQTSSGRTSLYVACLNGKIDVVKILLNAGADVNIVANNGRNAFFAACVHSNDEIMKLLITHDVDTRFTYDYALRNNKFDVIKILILYANVEPYDIYVTNLNTSDNIKNLLVHYKRAAKYIANWMFNHLYKPGGIMVRKEKRNFEKCLKEMVNKKSKPF